MQAFQINSIDDLEKLSHQVRWQYFEKLAALVFEKNGFDARQNVVVKFGSTRRQFDVLAERYNQIFAVECKKQQKLSVSSTIDKHTERCLLLSESLKKEVRPLIVTLCGEILEAEIPVVPLIKLNAFILENI